MSNGWLYISQILLVVSSIYISVADSKKKIYLVNFLFNVLCLTMYLIQRDTSSSVIYLFITIRSLLYTLRKKSTGDWVPVTCTIAQLTIGCLSYSNPWNIISIAAPTISCLYLWYCKDLQNMRLWNVLNHSLWLIYNIQAGLLIAAISRVIIVISNMISYLKEKCK